MNESHPELVFSTSCIFFCNDALCLAAIFLTGCRKGILTPESALYASETGFYDSASGRVVDMLDTVVD
jgi:hypothetical protein